MGGPKGTIVAIKSPLPASVLGPGYRLHTSRRTVFRGSRLQSDTECWQFGPFVIDRRRRLLSAHGKTVKLDAKAFDLLEYLVGRRHEAPTRDEIARTAAEPLRPRLPPPPPPDAAC